MIIQEVGDVRMLLHRKNIWSMDEREFVEIGKKMVKLGISEKCHSVGISWEIVNFREKWKFS